MLLQGLAMWALWKVVELGDTHNLFCLGKMKIAEGRGQDRRA